jgi:Na+-transporting NADH:ubiquinone oxidoreductase subunit C
VSEKPLKSGHTNNQVITFIVILSFVCALILSLLASALAEPKEIAKELDRSKEMMIAAKMMSHDGYFLEEDKEGKYIPAKYEKGLLVAGSVNDIPSRNEIIEIYQKRLIPYLVDSKGNLTTFKKAAIDQDEYLSKYKKTGYYKESLKLLFAIMPNNEDQDAKPIGYVIPVNGYGLWDAIYGFIALKTDGDTVIGISWYDQKETPGLGAGITEAYWQDLFPGKLIFLETPGGKTDFKTAPIGITVVRGKVSEVLGDSPKAKSAVDGMAGATLTGNGVTEAYKTVLDAYRPFLIKIHDENSKG